MSRIVKTAMGKTLDMAALMRKNEETIAVSNKNMNARGDVLDKERKKIIPVGKISRAQHQHSEPTESVGMSEVTEPRKATTRKKASANKAPVREVIEKVEKTDEDGNTYFEIEYDDGSIEVVKDEK